MTVDLSTPVLKGAGIPWYLPSIHSAFTQTISAAIYDLRPNRQPASLLSPSKLNFLLPNSFFYYPRAMYSAGSAEFDLEKNLVIDKSILSRDTRDTWILADCGGYQAKSGKLGMDYKYPDKYLEKNLRWQEQVANVGMYLEIPIEIADTPYFEEKSETGTYKNEKGESTSRDKNIFYNRKAALLELTEQCFDYFAKNNPNNFPLCMPIHGGNIDEAIEWYERFKKYEHCGYAFGGALSVDVTNLCLLADHIRRDGGFNNGQGEYFHIFGVGHARAMIAYTVLMGVLRKHCNPNLQLTLDASSPGLHAAKFGQVYNEFTVDPNEFLTSPYAAKFEDIVKKLHPDMHYPYAGDSPVFKNILVKDLLSDKNRSNSDGLTASIVTANNVYMHVQSLYFVMERVFRDVEILTNKLNEKAFLGKEFDEYLINEDFTIKEDAAAAFLYLHSVCDTLMVYSGSLNDVDKRRDLAEDFRDRIDKITTLKDGSKFKT